MTINEVITELKSLIESGIGNGEIDSLRKVFTYSFPEAIATVDMPCILIYPNSSPFTIEGINIEETAHKKISIAFEVWTETTSLTEAKKACLSISEYMAEWLLKNEARITDSGRTFDTETEIIDAETDRSTFACGIRFTIHYLQTIEVDFQY